MSSPVIGTRWALKYLLTERRRANGCTGVTGARAEIGELERGGVLVAGRVLLCHYACRELVQVAGERLRLGIRIWELEAESGHMIPGPQCRGLPFGGSLPLAGGCVKTGPKRTETGQREKRE